MKRKILIRQMIEAGCFLKRHGQNHDIYENTLNGKKVSVPRHDETKETLCLLIKKQLGII
jgi:mRNA interferase HicA